MIPALLERRAAVVRSVRAFFDERGFVEVETPVRIAAPAPGICRATRRQSELTPRIARKSPSAQNAVPQTPTRTPPGAQTEPRRSCSP